MPKAYTMQFQGCSKGNKSDLDFACEFGTHFYHWFESAGKILKGCVTLLCLSSLKTRSLKCQL